MGPIATTSALRASLDRGSASDGKQASSWVGYAAAAVAFTFAAVSLGWVLGGTVALSTLGNRIEELVLARDPTLITLTWVVVVLKVAGGLLALALVQSWGLRLPQRPLRLTASIGAAALIAYGVLQEASVALIALGLTSAERPAGSVLLWRLLLWEPWFIVWGVLLGLTARQARSRARRS